MNDHLFTDNDALRLITQFEGAPRLKARMCEGGAWELSYGVTFDLDGSPFTAESICTEDHAMALFRNALQLFEDAVKRLVTVPLNSHQFGALVALCYNIGEAQFAKSTVLRETNLNRFDDAAAAFGMWVYATKGGHTQAYRGLLRRRYSEACLYLGYDWTEACEDDAIALKREPPVSLPGRDRVIYKTPFKDVLAVAQRYPLPEPADAILFEPAPTPAPVQKPAVAPAPDSAITTSTDTPAAPAHPEAKGGAVPARPNPAGAAPATSTPSAGTSSPPAIPAAGGSNLPPPVPLPKPAPPVVVAGQDGAKPKSPNTTLPADVPYKIDPNAGLKPLEESERAKGYVVQQVGIGIIRLGSLGVFGSTIQGGAQVVQGDPVLSNIILMGFVAAGIAIVGYVVATYGTWKKKRGEQKASQGLF